MSPVATFHEAIATSRNELHASFQGKKMAETMSLDDVRELYRIHQAGEQFLTPAECVAMQVVIERHFPKGPLHGEFEKIHGIAHARSFDFSLYDRAPRIASEA